MGVIRVIKNRDFVTINKTALHDTNLSWKAKGLHAYMLSMPDDWTFYNDELVKHAKDGKDSLKSALKELKEAGYVVRRRVKNQETGKFDGWETIVYEIPTDENTDDRKIHQSANPQLLINNNTNKLIELNNDNIYTIFNHWLSKQLIKHKSLNQKMKSHINARLQEYELEQLLKAIDNYDVIVNSDDYYWTHKWTLQDFMKPNNVVRFLDESEPFKTFAKSLQKNKKSNEIRMEDFDLDD